METLEGSGCAKRMEVLFFNDCGIKVEAMRAVTDLLSRDGLPALKTLIFNGNPDITDEGVVALANALLKAP